MEKSTRYEKQIRRWAWIFIIATVLSGLTAIPAQWEIKRMNQVLVYLLPDSMQDWLYQVETALDHTASYPFILYGFDWLAFGHFIIAFFFYGVVRDPLRNSWLVQAAMAACLLVIPYAFVLGAWRGIPLWWRLVDCLFGLVGLVPLLVIRNRVYCLQKDSALQLS